MNNKLQIILKKLTFIFIVSLFGSAILFSQDSEKPVPFCLTESTVNMTIGSVTLKAIDFNAGSYDNETPQTDLRFTFSEVLPQVDPEFDVSLNSSVRIFNETPNTTIEITMYVWDSTDNFDYCTVNVNMIENGALNGSVSGQFVHPTYSNNPPFQPCNIGSDVNIKLENIFNPTLNMNSVSSGENYAFENLESGTYKLSASNNTNNYNGVTTLDVVLVLKHILQLKPFVNPTTLFAADVRKDDEINTLDMIQMRRLILGRIDSFPQNTSWRFGDALQVFEQNQNPLEIGLNEQIYFTSIQDALIRDFIPIKIGDVNNSQSCLFNGINNDFEVETLAFEATFTKNYSSNRPINTSSIRSDDDTVSFNINNYLFGEEQEICIPITANNFNGIAGFQFPISWNENSLLFDKIVNPFSDELYSNQPNVEDGEIFIVWYNQSAEVLSLPDNTVLFELCFNVIDNSQTSLLSFESNYNFQSGVYDLLEPLPYIFNNGQVDFGQGCVPYMEVSLAISGVDLDAESFYNGEEDGDEILVNGESSIHFDCNDLGENEVLVTVAFANGTTESCTTSVNVQDKLYPIAIAGPEFDITLNNDYIYNISYEMIDNGSFDNCSELTYSVFPSTLDCDSANPSVITLTVIDGSGNSTSASTVVNINYPPHPGNAIACNSLVDINVVPILETEVTADMLLEGQTTCSSYYTVELFDDLNSPNPQNDNILDISDAGNTYVAEVSDPESGSSCWSNINISGNNNGLVRFTLPEVTVSQSDDVCVSMTIDNFYNLSAFQMPIAWNDEVLQFNEIKIDNNSPLSPNIYTNTIDNELYIVWNDILGLSLPNGTVVFDLCFTAIGNSGTSSELIDESVRPNFETEVVDSDGNVVNYDFVKGKINIQSAGCDNNVSVSLGITGATIYAESFYSGEQPGDEILVNGEASINFDCDDLGTNDVLITVNHSNGQTENCIVIVEVEDKLAPIAIVESEITATLPNELIYQLTPDMIDDGSYDNCSALTYSISPSVINCNSPNPTYAFLTVTDIFGNSSSAFTKVNIEYPDNISTILSCNDNIQISVTANNEVEITADMILEGGPYCYSYYDVNLFDDINSPEPQSDEILNITDVGNTYIAKVTDPQSKFSCWSTIQITAIDCDTPLTLDDIQWPCDISLDICDANNIEIKPQDLRNKGVNLACIEPMLNIIDCQLIGTAYADQVFIINSSLTKVIRNWTIIDWRVYEVGTTEGIFELEQIIELNNIAGQEFFVCDKKPWNTPTGNCESGHSLDDIVEWPGDIELSTYGISLNSLRENSNVHPYDVEPRIFNLCSDYELFYHDDIFNIDSSLVKVLRTWTLIDNQTGIVYEYIQIIRVNDVFLNGNICIFTENGLPIENVELFDNTFTNESGCEELVNISNGTIIKPSKDDEWTSGLDLMDLITMYKAILGAETLSPYQLIAADINENGQVTTLDAVLLEKIIAGQNVVPNVPVWKFVDASYQFANDVSIINVPQNYPNSINYNSTNMYQSFVGMKMGDLHQNFVSGQLADIYPNTFVSIEDEALNKGENYNINILSNENYLVEGIQLEFVYNSDNIEILNISSDILPDFSMTDHVILQGNKVKINYSLTFDDLLEDKSVNVNPGTSLFLIDLKAKDNSILNENIELNTEVLNILKSKDKSKPYKLNIKWDESISNSIKTIVNNIDVYVYPQPANDIVNIEYSGNSINNVNYTISNIVGQKMMSNKLINKTIDVSNLSNGLYLIHFENKNGYKAVKKLVISK